MWGALVALNNAVAKGPMEYVRYLTNHNMVYYVAPVCMHAEVNIRLQALWIIGNLAACEEVVSCTTKQKDVLRAIVQVYT